MTYTIDLSTIYRKRANDKTLVSRRWLLILRVTLHETMSSAFSWLLLSMVLLCTDCIETRCIPVFLDNSDDLSDDNECVGKRSADIIVSRMKTTKMTDSFRLNMLLVKMRHRLTLRRPVDSRLHSPRIRVDLLRARLQSLRAASDKEPMLFRGAVGDDEQLRMYLNGKQ